MNRHNRWVEALALFAVSVVAVPFGVGQEKPTPAKDDPLPKGAIQRLGSTRLRVRSGLNPSIGFDAKGDIVTAESGEICIWSSRDGRELQRIDRWRKRWPSFAGARLSADGKRLFVCDGLELVGWDLEKSSEMFRLACPCTNAYQGTSLVRTADDRVVCLSPGEGLTVVDTVKNPPVARKFAMKWKSDSHSLAVTPDGKTAAILDGSTITFVDLAALKVAREWKHDEEGVRNIVFLDNGRLAFMVSGSEKARGKLGVFDLKLGAAVTQESNVGYLQQMAISPDGKLLAFGDASDKVGILRTSDLSLAKIFESPISATGLSFSRDGKTLAVVDGSCVRLLDMETGDDRIPTTGHRSTVVSIDFSKSGDTIISSSIGNVIAWNAKTGAVEHEICDFAPHQVVRAYLIKDRLLTISTDGSMKYWDAKDFQPVGVLCDLRTKGTASTVSRDGKLYAFAEYPARLHVATIADAKNAKVIESGTDPITDLAFSPDGKILATESLSKSIKIVDIASEKIIKSFTPLEYSQLAMAFHPDGRLLICVGDETGSYLHNVLSSQTLENMNLAFGVTIMAFSGDGRLLATGDESRIQVWDFKERKILATFKGHRGSITCLKFSPDESILASGGQDTTILLWKVPKAK